MLVASAFMTINHICKHFQEHRKRHPTPISRSPFTYVADLLTIAAYVFGSALAAYLIIDGLADAGQVVVVTEDRTTAGGRL
jgi:hypothetical protein